MIKIAIVDDHKLFREGLVSLLNKQDGFSVIGSYENGRQFVDSLTKETPNIVLLDLSMPEMDGFEVLEFLKKSSYDLKIIALSMHNDGSYVAKCVRLGAYSYLLKNADEEQLLTAINTVIAGKKYFDQDISELMINNMALDSPTLGKLSPKELEVIKLISEGLTTKEIAENLIISTRTVETHRANMMRKLDVKNTAQLIKIATQLNLV